MAQQRDNSGSSFPNDRRREGKNDPNITGSIMVDGAEYWLDTWVKNHPRQPGYDPNKKTWYSHSLRRKDSQRQNRREAAPRRQAAPPPPPPSDNNGDLHPEEQGWK